MKICVSAVTSAAAVVALAGAASADFQTILNFGYETATNQAVTNSPSGFLQDSDTTNSQTGTDNIILSAGARGTWNGGGAPVASADEAAMSTFIAIDNRHTSEWLVDDGTFAPGGPQQVSGDSWSNVSTGAFTPGDSTIGGPGIGTAIGFGGLGMTGNHPTAEIALSGGTFVGVFATRFVVDAGSTVTGAAGATTDMLFTDSFLFPANGRSGLGPTVTRGDGTPMAAYFELSAGAGPNGADVIDLYIVEVPAPGAAALLGLGGLAGLRRRR